jgi:bisphosphoglycerate-independent phosphoglycerate mutase (AlkP superfamily)
MIYMLLKEGEKDEEKQIQEKLEAHAIQKSTKENENLILMTQNYHKYFDHCECSTIAVPSKILNNAKTNWMSSEKLNELRRKAHEAVRNHKVFILKGYFHTVRKALTDRGWVRYFYIYIYVFRPLI